MRHKGVSTSVFAALVFVLCPFAQAATLTLSRTVSGGYVPGTTLDVTVTLHLQGGGALSGLGMEETLPEGWTYKTLVSGSLPQIAPSTPVNFVEFVWNPPPAFTDGTASFTYRVAVPAGQTGVKQISGAAIYRVQGEPGEKQSQAVATSVEPGSVSVAITPNGAIKYAGGSVTFTAVISGGVPPFYYRWTRAGVELGTSSSLSFPSLTVANAGWYKVAIIDSNNNNAESLAARLQVAKRLAIVTQPQAGNKYTGGSITLSTATTGGYLPLTYSWRKGLTEIGTTPTYVDALLDLADTGWYSVVIRDANLDVIQSAPTSLNVRGHAVISTQPVGANKYVGQSYTFLVTANGGYTPFTYTWKKGINTVGAGALLELSNLQQTDTGNYTAYAKDANIDLIQSQVVPLVVKPRVFVTAQPLGAQVPAGSPYMFSVGVNGGYPPYSFTWLKGTTVIGNGPTFTVPAMSFNDQGWYSVVVSDSYADSRTSASARLTMRGAKTRK